MNGKGMMIRKRLMSSSVDVDEIKRFASLSKHWWNPTENPSFKLLHALNKLRIPYIAKQLQQLHQPGQIALLNPDCATKIFNEKHILDVGCGGGLLSEPLARLGAVVHGIDACNENILIAREHLQKQQEASQLQLTYANETLESLCAAPQKKKFDVIIASEVIEHVTNPESFIKDAAALLKENGRGLLFISTINRNVLSGILTITIAERLLGWIPKGTHSYSKYVKPEEAVQYCQRGGMSVLSVDGFIYNVLSGRFQLSSSFDKIHYFMSATKS